MFKLHFIKYHDITENACPRTMALSWHHTLCWYYSVSVTLKLKLYRQYKQNQKIKYQNQYIHFPGTFFVCMILKLFRNSNPRMRKVPMTGDLPTQH